MHVLVVKLSCKWRAELYPGTFAVFDENDCLVADGPWRWNAAHMSVEPNVIDVDGDYDSLEAYKVWEEVTQAYVKKLAESCVS